MVKTKHLVALAGLIWTMVGTALFMLGVSLVGESSFFYPLIAVGILVGFFKASAVLKKTAEKTAKRLLGNEKGSIFELFNLRYLALILAMMGLGFAMRFCGTPNLVRGTVDLAVGSALFTGSFFYFRHLW